MKRAMKRAWKEVANGHVMPVPGGWLFYDSDFQQVVLVPDRFHFDREWRELHADYFNALEVW